MNIKQGLGVGVNHHVLQAVAQIIYRKTRINMKAAYTIYRKDRSFWSKQNWKSIHCRIMVQNVQIFNLQAD